MSSDDFVLFIQRLELLLDYILDEKPHCVIFSSDFNCRSQQWWHGDIRELKQTDAAAANLQISIQKDSRPSEFSRPLTAITLNLNGNLPVDRRRVSLLKLPIENEEVVALDEFIESNNLTQLIDQPTHIMNESRSCIDLIITDQPNFLVDYGVHPSNY